jgi:hypothetical protein
MAGQFKMLNGVRVELTDAEEATRTTYLEQYAIEKQARVDAAAQKATNKASAKAKLIAGESLTEAEADTIVL